MSVVIPDPLFGILSQACNYVWDVNLLDWVPMEQPIIEGGTIVVGSVDQGTGGVSPWLITGSVTTGGLTDTQLRATPVPVSGTVSANISGSISNTSFIATQATGTNLHTVVDSGSVTATGSGNFTVVQGTGTNLHTVVDSGSINVGTVTTLPSITGTVTANAGTNLNTSLLALESGGNLATIAGKDFATQTTLALLAGYALALNTAQQAAASGVVGPMVQARVDQSAPNYLDDLIAPLSLTMSARLRTISETEEAATAWDNTEDTGWNQRPSAMNFDTTNMTTIDTVWSS